MLLSIPLKQGLHSSIKCQSLDGPLHIPHITLIHKHTYLNSHIKHHHSKHHNSKQLGLQNANYFLGIWQARGFTYGICEVVSHLTKLGVGWDTIFSRDGGCQIVGSKPTGKMTSITRRIGWAKVFPKCLFPIEVEGFDVPGILWSRWAATVLGLVLFLGGCSPDGKVRDAWWAALFLRAVDFFSLRVVWGVGFNPISVVSNTLEGDFTSEWVGITCITGGGENNHLSSLKNAWGECRGVTGRVFDPSSKGSSSISGEGSTGRKGSLSLRMFILFTSLSSFNKSCEQSILQTFH